MVSTFAFLHHVAAFALVGALAIEFVLIKDELTVRSARKLLLTDLVFGASAGVVVVVGLVRVFYFEKGASYYFHSVPFITKLSLFAVVGLLSIYPTVTFLSWRTALKQGLIPVVDASKISFVRHIMHWERVAIEQLAQVREQHTPSGRHISRIVPFPQWAPPEVLAQAKAIDEQQALAILGAWVRPARR